MSDSLMKPCPCCGQQESVKIMKASEEDSFDASNDDTYAIICDFTDGGCGCCGGHRLTLDEAIEVWNRRAPAQQPAAAPVTDTGLPELRDLLKIAAVYGEPILLSHISAGALYHAMTTGKPASAPVSGDVALPELPTPDHALDMGMQPFYRPDQMHAYARTYGQQCSDAGFNAGLDAAYSTYAPTEDEAWSIYNVQGGWGHEPTAKGLFIDGYRAASPKSAIVALRNLVDELLAGDDEGLIQHSDAMQSAIRALKGGTA